MINIIEYLTRKIIPISLVLSLALTAIPAQAVFAAGLADTDNPPDAVAQFTDGRVEQAWARLQKAYDRQGQMLEKADTFTGKVQDMLDKMKENGKDTSSLQAALDAFTAEIKNAHPVYESANGIVKSHKGFDNEGNVIDHELAVETVKSLAEKIREVHQLVGEPGKALKEALRSLRETRQKERVSAPQG
jgi:predicted transcriptional regulator